MPLTRTLEYLRLFVNPRDKSRGTLRAGPFSAPAALGARGLTHFPHEGDKATPAGTFALMKVFYRPDRVQRPRTGLPVRPLRVTDGWGDQPFHPLYNRPVNHPAPISAEKLWRADHLYDIIVVINFNVMPRQQGLGSAIFFHIARPDFAPTLGCIAIPEPFMQRILPLCGPRTFLATK